VRHSLQIKCAFVALTGRGVVSIIQAIVGVIFSIEGFWGAVKFDTATVKRFLIFLVAYFFVSVGISVIDIQTINDYCSTAVNDDDRKSCKDQATMYSYLLLAASLVVVVRHAQRHARTHTVHKPAGRPGLPC
jgi:hypothetical protein